MNRNLYDAIVVGGGPAGLTSAIYLARAQYRVLVVEKENFGGQIRITNEVVNYPGVYNTDGQSLTDTMRRQAEAFGAEFMVAKVNELDLEGDVKKVHTDRGTLETYSIVLSMGANPRKIGFEGEEEFQGRGVAYCATCDGEFFTGKDVIVIGGGFAASEESVFLTKYANHVTIFVRGEDFTCAKSAAEPAKNHEKITVHYNSEVVKVSGDNAITEAVIKNRITGEEITFRSSNGENFGVFVLAGYIPNTELVKGKIDLDQSGYIKTYDGQKTSVEGVFAAGDLCIKDLRQVATAVSDGAIAATQAEKHIHSIHEKTGVIPEIPSEVLEQAKKTKAKYITKSEEKSENVEAKKQESSSSGLDPEIVEQLESVFSRFTKDITLKVYKNDNPASEELSSMMQEMAKLSDKISFEEYDRTEATSEVELSERPVVKVFDEDYSPIAFHGVPGGHEFQSFVLGLYNMASDGQQIPEEQINQIKELDATKLDIVVSLSCTQCPDLVVAAQRLATLSDKITVDVYDINHFEAIKNEYDIMSVPCIIFNDGKKVAFGKKDIAQLIELIKEV